MRDMDYVRNLLEEFEAMGDFPKLEKTLDISEKKFNHLLIMEDAGLLSSMENGQGWRLSWQGYDFLDALRDEGVWIQTKKAVKEAGGSFTFEILKRVATAFAEEKIEKHTGLKI